MFLGFKMRLTNCNKFCTCCVVFGKTDNDTILEGIEMEKHLYDDLIVANFVDSYDNLTLKTMASLEWIDNYCNQSEYVLKTDDDMFINVPNLLSFMDKIEVEDRKQPKLYGRLARKWKPVRNKKSKYYISFQQFRKTVYPDFTTGPAYLFSTRLVRPLLEKGNRKETKSFHLNPKIHTFCSIKMGFLYIPSCAYTPFASPVCVQPDYYSRVI